MSEHRQNNVHTKKVAVIGSTGSIGTQTLEVITASQGEFQAVALVAKSNAELLLEQAKQYQPEMVGIVDESAADFLKENLPKHIELVAGEKALLAGVLAGDTILNAVVGFAGLQVTVGTLTAGKRLALANKESLIAGAPVVQRARAFPGAEIVPVDSEHCAIHQCLKAKPNVLGAAVEEPYQLSGADILPTEAAVSRLLITASGGPFYGRERRDLEEVTLEEALTHPTWSMGPKITIDSSTLMNKGLEVIEAHELFGVSYDKIEVVVHRQSIIHSMVEFCDGAVIAQLSYPDMRLPIGYALNYPDRFFQPYGKLDFTQLARLDFGVPDLDTFTCLALAYEAGRVGDSAPACLNAANEVAVQAFLDSKISWLQIEEVVAETLDRHNVTKLLDVEDVLYVDKEARELAEKIVEKITS
ncbi:MAG: 1-deoxy-D-xylulose-5-phosphate reductoisomerase [Firmicutes bacterium]|nr:1-deoxy-D-xylulose-5-phosphate reductoisomerase [Bacillota bacterium]